MVLTSAFGTFPFLEYIILYRQSVDLSIVVLCQSSGIVISHIFCCSVHFEADDFHGVRISFARSSSWGTDGNVWHDLDIISDKDHYAHADRTV